MNKKSSLLTGLIQSSILSLLFLFYFYGDVLLSPNQYLFSDQSDGMKNYYTYIYQINKNSSFTNFEGFNYPYGENHLYTDSQPLISSALQLLSEYFPAIGEYSIGIINFLMLVSYLFAAIFIYLILRELLLPNWLASICSLSIIMLSPQIFRLGGHYALSYTFVIPMMSWLLIKFNHTRWNKTLLLCFFLLNLSFLFIHAYLGIISISLCVLYALIQFILTKKKNYLFLLIFSLTPIIIFRVYAFLSDNHQYRTDNPYGFFEYYADFDTVLLPTFGGLKEYITRYLPEFNQTWEGFSYIGLSCILSTSILFFILLIKRLKGEQFSYNLSPKNPITALTIVSFILLVFSFGIPFRWGLQNLLEYFPILKQFRAIGRFAWPFYYLINIATIYLLYHWLLKTNLKKSFRVSVLICFPLLMAFESIDQHQWYSWQITKERNLFLKSNLSDDLKKALKQIEPNDYQAIIPLPFYHIGSENFEKEGSDKIYRLSMICSYHLELPMLSSYLSRPSIKESKRIMQLFSSDFYYKPIKEDITNPKDFLIISSKESLNPNEKEILQKSELVYDDNNFILKKIGVKELFQNKANEVYQNFVNIEDSLSSINGFLSLDSLSFIHYNGFNESVQKINRYGAGALTIKKNQWNKLASIPSEQLTNGKKYIANFWVYNFGTNWGQDQINNLNFYVREVSEGEIIQEHSYVVNESLEIDGNWTAVISTPFQKSTHISEFQFWLKGFEYQEREIIIDEFFVYPQGSKYYQKRDSVLFLNNQFVPFSSR